MENHLKEKCIGLITHCLKSVQILSYFWPAFSCIRTEYGGLLRKSLYSVRIQENTGPEINLYLETFHAVTISEVP